MFFFHFTPQETGSEKLFQRYSQRMWSSTNGFSPLLKTECCIGPALGVQGKVMVLNFANRNHVLDALDS